MTDARKALESAREALDTVVRFTGNNHCKMQTVAADEALAALGDTASEALAAIDAALASGEQGRTGEATQFNQIGMTLNFFASVIKSGEPWTATCQREFDAAHACLTQLRPAPPAPETRT